ncbi:MAG: sulfotransferase [Candidatus Thermoplasmatota archaeon]|nr:sulfotransferase [Candidatus Thermoplasmatota archaeon]
MRLLLFWSDMMDTPPLFIVGCRRSGTTLLLNALNRHSEVGLFPGETHFLDDVVPRVRSFTSGALSEVIENMDDAIWMADVPGAEAVDVARCIAAAVGEKTSARMFFRSFPQQAADMQNARVWGEKTPTHVYHVDTLKEWFPEARCIHMVRDPRGVAASHVYRMSRKAFPDVSPRLAYMHYTFPCIIHRWKTAAALAQKYDALYDDYMVLRFETFLDNLGKVMREVCSFLDISFQSHMLDLPVYHSSYNVDNAGVDTGAAQRWRKKSPWWANRLIELVCHDYMQRFGYLSGGE